jgi:hypothetical protein
MALVMGAAGVNCNSLHGLNGKNLIVTERRDM